MMRVMRAPWHPGTGDGVCPEMRSWSGRPDRTDLISIRDIYVMLWRYFNIFCWRTLHQQITFAAFQAFFEKKQLADLSFLLVTLVTNKGQSYCKTAAALKHSLLPPHWRHRHQTTLFELLIFNLRLLVNSRITLTPPGVSHIAINYKVWVFCRQNFSSFSKFPNKN